MMPTLFSCEKGLSATTPHEVEAFGPVSTVIGYDSTEEAIALVKKGRGSLVGSVMTNDEDFARDLVLGVASHHARFVVHNRHCYKESTGHGSPMPALVHGGPGRAGGGEEMGGIRGVFHYMQRTAIQGHPNSLTKITQVYQPGADRPEDRIHPFRKYFDELEIGETLTTHKRTVTEADIVNFANISGDNFYAHMDETSLEGTLFERRVAHGYFVMSAAAGLFVDPKKGPVLANYGVDEFRFVKPVYVGATIGVKLTVKEKIQQEKRGDDDVLKGIVKWQVDVIDEEGETCALGTILTLVANKVS
jgi:oxepin-CoA hydrolase/3-oxo-5,6-dehydrosuberyl-CoA semialdehyde dehydrogenase